MRRSDSYFRIIASVLFLAAGAYAAACILEKSEQVYVTEKAEYCTVRESFSVRGRAYRELTEINADPDDCIILAAEGEYLSGGSAVAVRSEDADAYFAYCDYKLGKTKFSSEEDAVDAVINGDSTARALAVSYLENADPPEKAPCPDGIIYAPCAGIFTRAAGNIGAIASETNWYFSFESEKASLLNENQKLNLKISSGPEAEAEVFSINENEVSLIVRSCADFIPEKDTYEAEISISDCEGIKVPRSAVCFDENGSPFVYTLSAGQKEITPVEIIYTSSDFYLCDDRSLHEGTEIIISEN